MKFNLEILPGLAGTLGLISFGTLLLRVYDTKNTTSFPYAWILINLIAQSLACTYGLIKGAYGIYLPNMLFITGLFYLLYVKLTEPDQTVIMPIKVDTAYKN